MRIKEYAAQVKAADEPGTFDALVSVFGNVDSMGDMVMPGAFTKSLDAWAASGDPLPVVWSHKWDDPFAHIGHVVEASETDRGLVVRGVLDLDNPQAAQVHKLLKARRVKQFSFAYDVTDGAWVEPDDGPSYYALRELAVHEVGPTLLGANRETELIAAKAAVISAGVKAGRVLSGANYDRLRDAHTAIGDVLAAAEPEKTEPKSSHADGPPADENPASAGQSGRAATSAPRRALAVARIRNL